ncbi:hypothetical protein ACJZ2D_010822 [Fusarium nematophilum]
MRPERSIEHIPLTERPRLAPRGGMEIAWKWIAKDDSLFEAPFESSAKFSGTDKSAVVQRRVSRVGHSKSKSDRVAIGTGDGRRLSRPCSRCRLPDWQVPASRLVPGFPSGSDPAVRAVTCCQARYAAPAPRPLDCCRLRRLVLVLHPARGDGPHTKRPVSLSARRCLGTNSGTFEDLISGPEVSRNGAFIQGGPEPGWDFFALLEQTPPERTGGGLTARCALTTAARSRLLPRQKKAGKACWRLPLPEPRLIGELVATTGDDGEILLSIEPDRHHGLGGPFSSVRDYLRAYIKSALTSLEKQQGIDDYKETFLDRIRDFVNNGLHNIPAVVENMPIVAMHSDMGPHNVIVSSHSRSDIKAIIDWEFVAGAPFMALHRIIEMLFRRPAANDFGREYDRADELRETFWSAIPDWKRWNDDESTQVFLEWFRFGMFLKPEWRPRDLPIHEAEEFWRENIRVVEEILVKYS